MHLKNTAQCLVHSKYTVSIRSQYYNGGHSILQQLHLVLKKTNIKQLSMFQNKKHQAEIGDRELLKFINYVEDSLNSVISPGKVPA